MLLRAPELRCLRALVLRRVLSVLLWTERLDNRDSIFNRDHILDLAVMRQSILESGLLLLASECFSRARPD